MPAKSKAQRRMMGADLQRKQEGKATRTGMETVELKAFASMPEKNLPKRVKKSKKGKR